MLQVLDQFSELGESLITVLTVSLPGLLGSLRTDAWTALEEVKRRHMVKSTIIMFLRESSPPKVSTSKLKKLVKQETLVV